MAPEILPFTRARAPYFDTLNRAWIEALFAMEPKDYDILMHPEESIIGKGGEVWFGALNHEVVGACALILHETGVMEFSKLGVAEAARGKGVARALLRHSVERARARGMHTLRIYTNSKLPAANALYQSEGFELVEMNDAQRKAYARVDIMYEMPLRQDTLKRA